VDPPRAAEIDVLLANTLPDGLLARCPRLRWLHLTGTGVEHLVRAEPSSDLLVTNSPDVPARAVAEFAWMGLLALAKDAPRLAALPPQAPVINVSRASVLDTTALVAALESGRLRGALLDVHDEEPLPPESPLWDVERLWITPHGAYRFPEEEAEIARLFVENLTRLREGRELRNRVHVPELEPAL